MDNYKYKQQQQQISVEASQRLLQDIDICDDLAFGIGIPQEFSDLSIKFGSLDDCLGLSSDNNSINNNNSVLINNNRTTVGWISKQENVQFNPTPNSPSGSWISTDDFPEEIGDLDPELSGLYESGIESDESAGEFTIDVTVPVIKVEEVSDEDTEDSMNIDDSFKEEEEEEEDEEMNRSQTRRGVRTKRRPRRYSSDTDTDSESDPDFDPEEFEELEPALKRVKLVKKTVQPTSDYESEEFESEPTEKGAKRERRPSRNPIPQQRKKGSKLKISQWIVSLLRDPGTNPSVITWVDEQKGKFKIVNSTRYAELWGKVKHNPNMNYEKLSRAMRYYYKNKEIAIVAGERLTYAFGPSMRDFRAKNRDDPNFEMLHSKY